jgi:hypothetical protein
MIKASIIASHFGAYDLTLGRGLTQLFHRRSRPSLAEMCAVEASAWLNSSNSFACCSAVIATSLHQIADALNARGQHGARWPMVCELSEQRVGRRPIRRAKSGEAAHTVSTALPLARRVRLPWLR